MVYNSAYTGVQIDKSTRRSNDPYMLSLQQDTADTTTCTIADQWYDLGGDFSDGISPHGFTFVTSGGEMTYVGSDSSKLLFSGVANIDIGSNASTITFGLFLDSGSGFVEVPRFNFQTVFDTAEASKTSSIVGTTSIAIQSGWKMKIMVKSSQAGVPVEILTMMWSVIELGD